MAAHMAAIFVLLLLLPVPSSSSHLTFKLNGHVYPGGYFYVTMEIGEKMYNLDVDTGSVLTWVQCHVPDCGRINCNTWKQPQKLYELEAGSDKHVPGTDQLCRALHSEPAPSDEQRCGYSINYVVGSSHGFLIRDKFTLPIGRNVQKTIAFGCGYDQSGEEQEQPVDGILGLGRGSPVSLISQLMKENIITKDVIAHCISADGGGFLHIGDYEHSSADGVRMNPKEKQGHYSPIVSAELNLKGTMIRNNMNVVTGSLGNSLTPVADTEFELCWKGSNKFKSVGEVKSFFKPIFLIFRFGKKKATFDIPPENYLFIKDGTVCFGILDGSRYSALGNINVIGVISMQNRVLIYDNVGGKISWVPDSCKIKSESVITSRL
ncbi:hypothetical protein EJB05_44413, partial [Eragrostis curvula]